MDSSFPWKFVKKGQEIFHYDESLPLEPAMIKRAGGNQSDSIIYDIKRPPSMGGDIEKIINVVPSEQGDMIHFPGNLESQLLEDTIHKNDLG